MNPIQFGRAFTSKEHETFKKITKDAKEELGLKNTRLILFDFGVPADAKKDIDTGIGSIWSDSGIDFVKFAQTMFGINSIQVEPQGALSGNSPCPYHSSVFGLGEHIIDPIKLASNEYENLITLDEIRELSKGATDNPNYVNYRNVLDKNENGQIIEGTQTKILNRVYENYKKLDKNSPLNQEFSKFKEENKDWLEKYGIYELLFDLNGQNHFLQRVRGDKITEWENKDHFYLYSSKTSEEKRRAIIDDLLSKPENRDFYEKKILMQFLADKQHKNAKKIYNNMGISLTGDCLIGFSKQEQWAYQDLFDLDSVIGTHTNREKNKINYDDWNIPALNFKSLKKEIDEKNVDGPIHKFLERKFDKFFDRYDAVRIDAAWAHKNPVILPHDMTKRTPHLYDESGKIQYPYDLGSAVFDILEKTVERKFGKDYDKTNLVAELLGPDSGPSENILKQRGYAMTHCTRWAHEGWGRADFYKYHPRYLGTNVELGIINHDHESAIDLANEIITERSQHPDKKDQPRLLKRDLKLDEDITTIPEFLAAKFAELFTVPNQYYTYTDAMGRDEKINAKWDARLPKDYERFYHEQAIKGLGLNLPDAYAKALKAQDNKNLELIAKLENAAEILKQDGALTTEEADEKLGKDYDYINI